MPKTPPKTPESPAIFDIHAVSVEVAAGVVNRSVRHFHELVKQGTLPAPLSWGKYDLTALVAAWVIYKTGEGDTTAKDENLRYLRAKADNEELDAAAKAGELIHLDVVLETVREAMAEIKGELEGMTGRQARVYAAETDAARIRLTMLGDVRAALDHGVATVAQLADERRHSRRDRRDAETASDEDGGPVGGSEPADSEGLGGAGPVPL